jgi:hypothetical protein
VTPERFRKLTEIYGAEPRRWPAAERKSALAYMLNHAAEAKAVLAESLALDDILDRYDVALLGAALREQIIGSAPVRPAAPKRSFWWQSVGLAGIGLAGALAGALVVTVLMPIHRQAADDDSGYVITVFDELPDGPDEQ